MGKRASRWTGALVVVILAAPLFSGCFSSLLYHTADTVPAGAVEFGFGWNVTKLDKIKWKSASGVEEADTSVLGTIPNPMPDLMLRIGLADDIDLGIQLHMLGGHLDAKFRLVNTDVFSLALAPGVGYSRPFIVWAEYAADLPIIATFKLHEYVQIYAAFKARISGWRFELLQDDDFQDFHTLGLGGSIGFSFGGKHWYIRPEVSYQNYTLGFEDDVDELEFAWFAFGVGFGFRFGDEDDEGSPEQQKKIDALEERLKKLEEGDKPPPKESSETEGVRERAKEASEDLKKEEDKRGDD